MSYFPILLRAEQKPLEHRSFSPSVIGSLVKAGHPVSVERSSTDPNFRRIFDDEEYEAVGATLVPTGTWPNAAPGTLIVGLKEIPEEDFALKNDHLSFAHCYKRQGGWEQVLSRFPRGGSTLYDLEFLVDEHQRRISAFGFHAGFTGAALAVKTLSWNLTHPNGEPLPSVASYTDGRGYYLNQDELVEQIRGDVAVIEKELGRKPTTMVLGALGRCGRGACELFAAVGLEVAQRSSVDVNWTRTTSWDLPQTRVPGPYKAIVEHDIFLNAIYLSEPIPPFINQELLAQPGRKLGVVCDVSCDTTNPHNPLPIYSINTTFDEPTVPVVIENDQNKTPLSVISIDHLPSMLPRESSISFSDGLREALLQLHQKDTYRVWTDAAKLFNEKVAELPEALRVKEA
ncbi:unnamed protein product [Clonostachys rhizophaga]|uniref:Saccharopine dehydrogenase [NAD(+), L-lysine-forming] n=1 Tax=Clonostachys rhizophaga TaxID=160324 RepID=A0A9N9W6Z4_9HYPO|nr:unnamed protein product [Clonostachys rhizophaga]